MKIAVLGAGFTGLAASLRLAQKGHQVTLFEKENSVGGLAGGFKQSDWEWTLEQSYHHWFTNDKNALTLAKELNQPVIIIRPKTDAWVNNQILPLDSPLSILTFPFLPLIDRLRMGLVAAFLKLLPNPDLLANQKALPWLKKTMGKKATHLIWEPLFQGKFGEFKEEVALTWFWARIKKRTPSLAYPEGGFQAFADKIAKEIKKLGGKIYLATTVNKIKLNSDGSFSLLTSPTLPTSTTFDKMICTLPSPIFTQITPNLSKYYIKKISSIPHLQSLNLILTTNQPILKDSYWLNITDTNFPFLVLAQHTNFMAAKHYGDRHILYIGNYLPNNHPYLKMSAQQLFKIYQPFLQKINPHYKLQTTNYQLFIQPNAQPIVTTDYQQLIPSFKTPVNNLYLANLDMVYPWDRGTNYALEMGEKIAKIINE